MAPSVVIQLRLNEAPCTYIVYLSCVRAVRRPASCRRCGSRRSGNGDLCRQGRRSPVERWIVPRYCRDRDGREPWTWRSLAVEAWGWAWDSYRASPPPNRTRCTAVWTAVFLVASPPLRAPTAWSPLCVKPQPHLGMSFENTFLRCFWKSKKRDFLRFLKWHLKKRE